MRAAGDSQLMPKGDTKCGVAGETQLLVSDDGFRTARRVCEDVDMSSHSTWQIGALLVLPDGSALGEAPRVSLPARLGFCAGLWRWGCAHHRGTD